ncbi:hypothetical protein LH464_07535 [Neorhizobium sp. T786]|uniref:hypothetical protein n=1 Tax=Pseudorhizobium xiangyangii TaxID=2883104 RepID=UPI001CFF6B8C|nr:hypothetical protein [Neorhizobium xiangyangii]MCB5202329.1 hypothetical protein [Neorhizobium xiangyangii]
MWPDQFNFILDDAEEVTLDVPAVVSEEDGPQEATSRRALKVRMAQEDYERIWPLAEARYQLDGKFAGKAITLIANNPHYHKWHPADGGTVDSTSDSGRQHTTKYVVVHFLLDDKRETVAAV